MGRQVGLPLSQFVWRFLNQAWECPCWECCNEPPFGHMDLDTSSEDEDDPNGLHHQLPWMAGTGLF